MNKIEIIKQNAAIIKGAVRQTFGMDEDERVNTTSIHSPTSASRFDDTGRNKDTIGEQEIPRSELHGIAIIVATIPYQNFDNYGAQEEKFEGGAVASFMNALGQRKTGQVECVIKDFEGNDVVINFPVMLCRGMTSERRASIRGLIRGSLAR